MKELVYKTNNDILVTNSILVAEKFGKEHKNILQAIQNLVAENSAAKNLFESSTYKVRGREYPMVVMGKDGFSYTEN